MKNKGASIITKDNVTILFNGKSHTVGRKFAETSGLIDAINDDNWELAVTLADRATGIKVQSKGEFQIENGIVSRNGQPIHNTITERILEFSERGIKFDSLVKFLDNILQNPSQRAVNEGYPFLEHKNLPVTDDGSFIAYKSVGSDYLSKASGRETVEVSIDGGVTWKTYVGRIPNNVGSIIKVARNLVDDDFRRECSYGLHVGCLEYSGPDGWYHSSSDKIVLVKVNPRDIVSVPNDHGRTKMRVCQYEVLADFQGALTEPVYSTSDNNFTGLTDSGSDEVECSDCYWSGRYSELFDYNCPDCGSEYIDAI